MTRLQQTYFRCSLSSPKYFFLFLLPSALALDSRASVSSIGEVSPLEATQPITMASFAHKISKSPIYLMRQFPLSTVVESSGHPLQLRENSKRNIPASYVGTHSELRLLDVSIDDGDFCQCDFQTRSEDRTPRSFEDPPNAVLPFFFHLRLDRWSEGGFGMPKDMRTCFFPWHDGCASLTHPQLALQTADSRKEILVIGQNNFRMI